MTFRDLLLGKNIKIFWDFFSFFQDYKNNFSIFFYWLFQVAAFSATLIFSVTLVLKYGAKTKVDNIGQLWLCHGITYMYFTVRKYSCKYVIMIITSVQQHISFKCEYIFAVVFQ